jgi:hypothetical protein
MQALTGYRVYVGTTCISVERKYFSGFYFSVGDSPIGLGGFTDNHQSLLSILRYKGAYVVVTQVDR